MDFKAAISKIYAKYSASKMQNWVSNPIDAQKKVFYELIEGGKKTLFGKDHSFSTIRSYKDFKTNVPLRDYEELKPYIEKVVEGKENILWKGKPIYLCKTSGTTSGSKYIPITKESISNHIDSARNALLSYIYETGETSFVSGKMIFLQGSPELSDTNGIPTGRLSGIVAHHVPSYLQKNRLPSMQTNCIDDWEAKVDAIVEETINENMTLISGIPPWVQMYFEKLLEKSGKETISELYKNFSLFVYGGVNFEPYKKSFEKLIGKKINGIETYPASEGFIAFQNSQKSNDLLLILNKGIFYEFIPVSEYGSKNAQRISLQDVEVGVNYVIVLNTNAGLWGYIIGDTVKFTSINPYKLKVTGRIKHFTSAFGEHVIAEEVEYAMKKAQAEYPCEINEFHVAPQVNPTDNEIAYHEWFIEFKTEPQNLQLFAKALDKAVQEKNTYYFDLRAGNMLDVIRIRKVKHNGFNSFMKAKGKLGGQNKTPRLSNDRSIAKQLDVFTLK